MNALTGASTLLLDTGPLLALVNRRDRHHAWVRGLLAGFDGHLVTCEAVISEAWFLAQSRLSPPERLLVLLERLALEVVPAWGPRALELVWKYRDQPMDVADACLVVLAEAETGRVVVTTDARDFSVYRMHDQQSVPTLMPPA
jgi:predicted nucleic acid-binding protein